MKTKLFSLLAVIVLSTGIICADKVQIGDLYYNLNETNFTAEVTSQNNSSPYWSTTITTADIPSSVTYNDVTYSVTSIGENAFYQCSGLTIVAIPSSVISVGGSAFWSCSSLISIDIPSSVTSIEGSAFMYCSSITYMSVAVENTIYDSRDNCNAIIETATGKLIAGCQNTVIPSSVTCIGNYAFDGCSGLTYIDIPNSVTSIEGWAFAYCSSLTSINILNTHWRN